MTDVRYRSLCPGSMRLRIFDGPPGAVYPLDFEDAAYDDARRE